jgi:hypothetical protein
VNRLRCGEAGELHLAGGYNDSIAFAPLAQLNGDGSFVVKGDDLTTSMTAPPIDQTWSVAPVPADGHFTITDRSGKALGEIAVTDAIGREVLRASTQEDTFSMDCSAWPSGSYVVHSGKLRERILVMH